MIGVNEWIYDVTSDNRYRFVLGQPRLFIDNWKPDAKLNVLICFGINPSTAEPYNLDNTLKSVVRIARNNRYDGWIMCNIYPQRATNPNDLDRESEPAMYRRNIVAIKELYEKYPNADLWAAWGTLITKRDYLHRSLYDINLSLRLVNPDAEWITFGERSQDGHPHHPLYLRQDSEKEWFRHMSEYVTSVREYTEKKRGRKKI